MADGNEAINWAFVRLPNQIRNERTTAAMRIEEATESHLKGQQREMVFPTIPIPSRETI
jgi:hypothetical protein